MPESDGTRSNGGCARIPQLSNGCPDAHAELDAQLDCSENLHACCARSIATELATYEGLAGRYGTRPLGKSCGSRRPARAGGAGPRDHSALILAALIVALH